MQEPSDENLLRELKDDEFRATKLIWEFLSRVRVEGVSSIQEISFAMGVFVCPDGHFGPFNAIEFDLLHHKFFNRDVTVNTSALITDSEHLDCYRPCTVFYCTHEGCRFSNEDGPNQGLLAFWVPSGIRKWVFF